jgi:hypothetical protein
MSHRHGGLRRRTPSEPQTHIAWSRRQADASQICAYDFRDAEAIAEAVQRPTMKFVATKTAEQLDLQALHRVRERLVSQRTGIINQIRAFLLERGIAVRQGAATGSSYLKLSRKLFSSDSNSGDPTPDSGVAGATEA